MKINKQQIKDMIRKEKKMIKGLKQDKSPHHKKSYPISLCEGRIEAYRRILNHDSDRGKTHQ